MSDRRSIWRQAAGASLLLAMAAAGRAEAAGDAAHGKALFAQCAACHSATPGQNKLGPSLAGVVGRSAAAAPGFHYSPAMKGSGLAWTPQNLDRYLAAPASVVKGTSMAFPGVPNAKDRADLIAYLGTLAAKR